MFGCTGIVTLVQYKGRIGFGGMTGFLRSAANGAEERMKAEAECENYSINDTPFE